MASGKAEARTLPAAGKPAKGAIFKAVPVLNDAEIGPYSDDVIVTGQPQVKTNPSSCPVRMRAGGFLVWNSGQLSVKNGNARRYQSFHEC